MWCKHFRYNEPNIFCLVDLILCGKKHVGCQVVKNLKTSPSHLRTSLSGVKKKTKTDRKAPWHYAAACYIFFHHFFRFALTFFFFLSWLCNTSGSHAIPSTTPTPVGVLGCFEVPHLVVSGCRVGYKILYVYCKWHEWQWVILCRCMGINAYKSL